MAMTNSFITGAFVLLVFFSHGKDTDAIYMGITPDDVTEFASDGNVRISCMPGDLSNEAKEIVLMHIKKGDNQIAEIHQSNVDTHEYVSHGNLKVVGYIDAVPAESYLNVTLLNPKSDSSGEYSCTVYYTDHAGTVREDVSKRNLTFHEASIKTLKDVIRDIDDKTKIFESKLNDLEAGVKSKAKTFESRLTDVESGMSRVEIQAEESESKFRRLVSGVTGIETKTGKQEAKLSGLESEVAWIRSEVGEQGFNLTDLESDVDWMKSNSGKYESKLTVLESDVAGIESKTGKYESNMADLKSDVTGIKSKLTNFTRFESIIFEKITTMEKKIEKQSKELKHLVGNENKEEGDVFSVKLHFGGELKDGINKICGFKQYYIRSEHFNETGCSSYTTPDEGYYRVGGYISQKGNGTLDMFVMNGSNGWNRIARTGEDFANRFVRGTALVHYEKGAVLRLGVKRTRGSAELNDYNVSFYGFQI